MAKLGTILVTGATGHQGGAVANRLLGRGHKIVAMTRHPESEKAKALEKRGAKVVKGDLDDEQSLRKALRGVWGTFAVQNTWEAGGLCPPPIEAVRQSSMDYAIMLEWFDRVGYNADITQMARESGIKPTRFSEWARKASW